MMHQTVESAIDKAITTMCGMTLSKLQNELGMDSDSEGTSSDEDEFGPLNFTCRKGHPNKRPKGQLIDKCTTCQDSVRC